MRAYPETRRAPSGFRGEPRSRRVASEVQVRRKADRRPALSAGVIAEQTAGGRVIDVEDGQVELRIAAVAGIKIHAADPLGRMAVEGPIDLGCRTEQLETPGQDHVRGL